ncbi:MAG: hypothetical protein WA637_03130, partial [Terriglobales bacterium]
LQPNLGQPGGRPLRPTPDPQPNPAPPPSDDPSLAPVKAPDLTNYLNPIIQQQQALNAKRAAVPPIDPNAVKPKAWERIVGTLLGATQLRNPENAGAVASQVVNRRRIGAEEARATALQPINEEQEALDKQMPLYTAAGRAAYEQADLGLRTAGENRQRAADKLTAGYRTDWNEIRQQRADDQAKAAQDRADQQKAALDERERHDNQVAALTDRLRTIEEQRLKNGGAGSEGDLPGLTEAQNRQWRVLRETLQPQIAVAMADHRAALQNGDTESAKAAADEVKRLTGVMMQKLDKIKPGLSSDLGLADNTPGPVTLNQRRGGFSGNISGSKEQAKSATTAPAAEKGAGEKVNELGGRKVGDVGVVRGQRVKITAIYKNGKFDYEPATGAQ